MKRRVFIAALVGGLLDAALGAEGQLPKANARVGMLLTGSPSDTTQSREQAAFRKKLGELGWSRGETSSSRPGGPRIPIVCPSLPPSWFAQGSTSS